MRAISIHRTAVAGIAVAACVLALLAVIASGARTPTRGTLLGQLQRPARSVPSHGRAFRTTLRRGSLRVRLALAINRAGLSDPARITLTGPGGKPVRSARVTLSYSMPSMKMWDVYASTLAPVAASPGSYGATEAVLGMPGTWRIALTVAQPGGRATRFALLDRMSS